MIIYLDAVFLLNYIIDFLLIIATNRLCGYPPTWGRTAAAAFAGSIYATVCMLPGFSALAHPAYRIISLAIMSVIAFGASLPALRKTSVFVLLGMALGGMAIGFGTSSISSILGTVVSLCVLCYIGFHDRPWGRKLIPVEITNGSRCVKILALCDTGNLLRDPVTGRSVLVVGRDVCEKLIGLSVNQLRNPIETISNSSIPGLRLIPYKTIGQSEGFLLGLYFPVVKMGNVKGGSLVAFSPEILSNDGTYQALTGGAV